MAANEIQIQEVSGANPIRITLRGRAMPYRGMATGGEQRIVTTWYQGNPKATQQILGSTLEDTELLGMWKSKFVRVGRTGEPFLDVEIENVPSAFAFGLGTTLGDANPASVVVGVFETLRDRGKELRFIWGDVIRYGLLRSFTPTWDRYEDVSFAMTFAWNGKVERSPRAGRVATLGQPVQTALVNSDNALVAMPASVLGDTRARLLSQMSNLRARTLDLLAYVRRASSVVTLPLQIVQGAAGTVSQLEQDSADIVSECFAVPYEAFTTFDSVIDVFKAENFRRTLGMEVESLTVKSVQERDRMNNLSVDLGNSIRVRTQQRTSLRSLAARYYGSQDDWTLIAEANGLDASVVEAGELIFIPISSTTVNSEAPR
jgi:hypothetical protein